MKVLVVGSGGREHALVWKLAQSKRITKLYAAPGNPGTAALAENVAIAADDCAALLRFAQEKGIELTVVGPEVPLVAGIQDLFVEAGLKVWGPSKAAARLEGSKVAMKEFLRRHNIPTAAFRVFDKAAAAHAYLDELTGGTVVKSDGLAAGKGVTVAKDAAEAHAAVKAIMEDRVFGGAGSQVVIEDILRGEEISIFALCDGRNAVLLEPAQDHKQVFDGDRGPNTGGMGAFSPAPGLLSNRDEDELVRRILLPTMTGLMKEGRPYTGLLYMGLMLTDAGPKVVEYNVRFGDPECQCLLPRLESDLLDLLLACCDGSLDRQEPSWSRDTVITVTLAAPGYPGNYPKGNPITGLDAANAVPGVQVFHAGTALVDDKLVTNGGRVLNVTARGKNLDEARERAYRACDLIHFDGKHHRRDIGRRSAAR
jgi:phosphoribosylamine--glycine ligase